MAQSEFLVKGNFNGVLVLEIVIATDKAEASAKVTATAKIVTPLPEQVS